MPITYPTSTILRVAFLDPVPQYWGFVQCVGLCSLDPSLKVLQLSAAMVGYVFIRPMQRPLHSLNNNDTGNLRVSFLMSSIYASVYGEDTLRVGLGKEGRCFSEIYWTNNGIT
jgi:hypothetical protein